MTIDENCRGNLTVCESFQSAAIFSSQNVTGSRKLAAGQYCTIEVDASAYTAHVLFEEQQDLGIMYNGYRYGEFITVEQGTKLDITVYNGNKENEIEYKFIFAGAHKLYAMLSVSFLSMFYAL